MGMEITPSRSPTCWCVGSFVESVTLVWTARGLTDSYIPVEFTWFGTFIVCGMGGIRDKDD